MTNCPLTCFGLVLQLHMSELNLYHLVFELPKQVRDPDFYQLLGIPQFTNNVRVIRDAAIRRQSELLKWQNYDDQKAIDDLQGEVVVAVQVLEDSTSRKAYDEQLRLRVASSSNASQSHVANAAKAAARALKETQATRGSSKDAARKPTARPDTPVPDWFRAKQLKQEPTDDAIITSPLENVPETTANPARAKLEPPMAESAHESVDPPVPPIPAPIRTDPPHTRDKKSTGSENSGETAKPQDKQKPKPADITQAVSQPNSQSVGAKAQQPLSPRARPNPKSGDGQPAGENRPTTQLVAKRPTGAKTGDTVVLDAPFRFRDLPTIIEANAGRLFLAVVGVASVYEPIEVAVFKHLVSLKSILWTLLVLPIRILVYLFSPLFGRSETRAQLGYVASSAWIRMRVQERHPLVKGSVTHRHIEIPGYCVACDAPTAKPPTVETFRIYDRQSVSYMFLAGLVVAYCAEPYLARWIYGPHLSGPQYFMSLGVSYLFSVLAMRPFLRARSYAISSTHCPQHGKSVFPMMTMQGSHYVMHVGSRDMQRRFDDGWEFDKGARDKGQKKGEG